MFSVKNNRVSSTATIAADARQLVKEAVLIAIKLGKTTQ